MRIAVPAYTFKTVANKPVKIKGIIMTVQKSFSTTRRFGVMICFLIFAPISHTLFVSPAFAQEKCETALTEAQTMYDAGRFAQAILRLNQCVPDRIPQEQRIGAYRLLAICYLNEDYREEARTAIRKIFDLKRQYESDVQDPKPYTDLVAEVKASLPKPLSEKLFGGVKKWLWLSGGAAGTFFAVRSFGKNPVEPDLPVPPELP